MERLRLSEASTAARLSQWAYLDPEQFYLKITEGQQLKFIDYIKSNETDTQAYIVGDNNGILWTVFRGTEPDKIKDWLTDFTFNLKDSLISEGKVHAGFLHAFGSIIHKLHSSLSRLHDSRKIAAGHSLGAAQAIISRCLGYDACYAFCAPRVGDKDFAEDFDRRFGETTWTFTRHLDPVPRLPPASWGYRQVGTQVYFHRDGTMDFEIKPWDRYPDVCFGNIKNYIEAAADPFADHSIEWMADKLEMLFLAQK